MSIILNLAGAVLLLAGFCLMALPYIAAGTVTLAPPMRRPARFFMVLGFVIMILGGLMVSV